MKNSITKMLAFICLIILSGCAASYRQINPPALVYNSHDLQDGISVSYKYDVLQEAGNKKYARKEALKNVKLVAVKITNNTEEVININKNVAFYSGMNQIMPMEPYVVKESIKQIVPAYLPYALLTFLTLNVTQDNQVDSYPIGLVVGPAVTIGNMAVAGTANTKMLEELNQYNLINLDIQPGETVFGIIGVSNLDYGPLSVKIRK